MGVVSSAGEDLRLADSPRTRWNCTARSTGSRARALPILRSRHRPTGSTSTGWTGCGSASLTLTNLSRDHLDYHGTLEAYLQAKLILFKRLVAADGIAVIEADHEVATEVVNAAKARSLRVIDVGRSARGIRLVDCATEGFSQVLTIEHGGRTHRVRLPLAGAFQVENALVAAGQAIAGGDDPAAVFGALEVLRGAKGRLELVGHKSGAPIFVDYAHKPDALAKALEALRPYARGRLIVVFGAGGDRDKGKRAVMGQIAAEMADRVIVTDDNPRSEDPAAEFVPRSSGAPAPRRWRSRGGYPPRRRGASSGRRALIAGKA